jgi:hypothetical protein
MKKIRNLSPIKKNLENTETSKANQTTAANTHTLPNYLKTTKSSPNNTTSNPKIKNNIPKNINEYKHLFNSFFNLSNLDWTLDLRDFSKLSEKNKKKIDIKNLTHINVPSFYDQDYQKFFNRTHLKTQSNSQEPFLHEKNPFELNHLVSKNPKTINSSQLNFETTLRKFKKPKGATIYNNNKKWKNLEYKPKTILNNFLPPITNKDKENFEKINKFLIRPYEKIFEKIEYNGANIIKKKMKINKNVTEGWMGDHLEREKYNMKYATKNMQSIRHLLTYHGNSLSNFEVGLRSFKGNIFNPLTKPKIIHKKKVYKSENKKNNEDIKI